jgi:hypothetical protein
MTEDWFFQQVNRPLGPGMPRESDGLATSGVDGIFAIGTVRGVNDRWARLVEAFQPTEYELVILAKNYLDRMMEVGFCFRCDGMSILIFVAYVTYSSSDEWSGGAGCAPAPRAHAGAVCGPRERGAEQRRPLGARRNEGPGIGSATHAVAGRAGGPWTRSANI